MDATLFQPASALLFGIGFIFLLLTLVILIRFVKRTSHRQRSESGARESLKSDNQQFVMSTFQGVIQRLKEQEQELERLRRREKERADLSQKLSENITRHMPTGLITVNRGGIITSSNPAAKEILQLRILETMHFTQILAMQGGLDEMISSCLNQGQRFHRAEMEVVLNNGLRKNLGISVSPIGSEGEEISGAVCLISDLTELVDLQKQVRLKESLAIVGEMSVGIAHEFKNSLGAIHLYAQLLQGESLPVDLNNNLKMIAKETEQLSAIFNEFLNFAKPQELDRKPLDLLALLEECFSEIQMDPRFKQIEFGAAGKPCIFWGDRILLKRALNNLLLNAAESILPGAAAGAVSGHIHFEVDHKPFPIEVQIRDNGCGIKAEDIGKLFIPFFTGKPTGTGLGLAIVQKIVLLHDGKIEVESSPGAGTSFRMLLPARPAGL